MEDEDTDPVMREALEWFVRIRDDRVDPICRERFEAWRSASRMNAEAFAKAESLWDRFEMLKPDYERHQRRRVLDRRSLLALAGAVVLGGPAAYVLTRPGRFADHRTDVAERRTVVLADGSQVELSGSSALSVRLGETSRILDLHYGEAFFHVAPDPTRSFAVRAGPGSVRALGTQFDVRLDGDAVTVSVLEHAVEISTGGTDAARVEEGWQATYDGSGIGRPARFDPAMVQAWRRDRIVFEDVPLRRVLAELERYRREPIVLMGRAAGEIPVTGVFDTRNSDDALRVIERTLPVRVLSAAGYATLVYPR